MNKLKHLPIKTQFVISMVFLLVCMLFLCLYVNISLYNTNIANTNTHISDGIAEFERYISSYETNISNICMQLQYSNVFSDYMSADSYHQLTSQDYNNLQEHIISTLMVNTYVTDLSLVNDLLHLSNTYQKDTLLDMQSQMPKNSGVYCFGLTTGTLYNAPSDPHLSFGYNIISQTGKPGTIFLSVDLSKILFFSAQDTYYILHNSDCGTFSPINCDPSLASTIMNEVREHMKAEQENGEVLTFTTSDFRIQTVFLPSLNCYATGAFALKALNQQLMNNIFQVLFIASLCILFLFLFWILITRSFINPFQKLSDTITYIRKEHIRKITFPLQIDGCKEILDTSREFENMLNSIHNLNNEIIQKSHALYEAELQRRISELSYLKSQIDPHFIYNTLELIRASATEHHVEEISDTALAMGKILRYSIKGKEFVTLQNELDITRAYLKIQHARFPQRLDFLINAPVEQEHLMVMKMLLQPIVENSVIHGIEPRQQHSMIIITAALSGNDLNICIRDNGVGIPPKQLETIQKALNSDLYDTSQHVGLINVHTRIRLQYGSPYGITIDSSETDGTVVNLHMPAVHDHEITRESVLPSFGKFWNES